MIDKNDKEDLLKSVAQEHKIAISNVLDKVSLSEKVDKIVYCDFYDKYQQKVIEAIFKKINVEYQLFGGFDDAERKILIINPGSKSSDLNIPISIIDITYNTNFGQNISHRDVLGTIISKGIKREKIGDILINEGKAQVLTNSEVCDYLLSNIDKINNVKVKVGIKDLSDIILPEVKFKEISTTVASLRLDCILEAGFGISRSNANDLISSESVFVNFEKVIKPSVNVKEGDIISARKFGRIIFEAINGKTKKDRFSVSIKRLI